MQLAPKAPGRRQKSSRLDIKSTKKDQKKSEYTPEPEEEAGDDEVDTFVSEGDPNDSDYLESEGYDESDISVICGLERAWEDTHRLATATRRYHR